MTAMFKYIPYYIQVVFLVFIIAACSEPYTKEAGFSSFAKVYGYVKYFHPSDEASKINWDQFAVYGAQEINKCSNKQELIACLNKIFRPIAPSVKFTNAKINGLVNQITPSNLDSSYRKTFWQHKSLQFYTKLAARSYKSKRYNRVKNDTLLFNRVLEFGEVTNCELTKGVFCNIPLVLYCNDRSTYPASDKKIFELFIKQIEGLSQDAKDLEVRIANAIIVYSTIKHFYPYFDELKDLKWDDKLNIALIQSLRDTSISMHCKTISEFTSHLQDGHIEYFNVENQVYSNPPIHLDYIEDKFIVTDILDEFTQFKLGDQITHINNIPILDYFDERKKYISASTEQSHIYKTNRTLLSGNYNSIVTLKIEGKDNSVRRNLGGYYATSGQPMHYQIDSSIYFVNLNTIEMDSLIELLPSLTEAPNIIFDLRFYPNKNSDILEYLIHKKISPKWMRIAEITHPDQQQPISFSQYGWALEPKKPTLSEKNIFFLSDVSGQSYTESVLGYVKSHNLGTIVGQPTAGINGNVIDFSLVGNQYTGRFTGMKVVNHDQSKFFGIGIEPDVYVHKTIKGIKEKRDEYLERAVELIKMDYRKQ